MSATEASALALATPSWNSIFAASILSRVSFSMPSNRICNRLKRSLDVLLVHCGNYIVHRNYPLTFCLMAVNPNVRNSIKPIVASHQQDIKDRPAPCQLFLRTA